MLKEERQEKILALINIHDYLGITEMAKILDVSSMTIRRDVTELADENQLVKLYGGAQKLTFKKKELSTQEKINLHIIEKEYIGELMNTLIKENDVVYIGAGTTLLYALPFISKKNIKIITNSLISFNYLVQRTNYEVQLTGGEFSKLTEEFIGAHAESMFNNLNIDISFAATNGIYGDNVTTSNSMEGGIQVTAFARSKKKIIVADSTKFNVSDVYTFCKLSDLDYVITDNKLKPEIYASYSELVEIIN